MGQFGIGQAVTRIEDQRLLTGGGRYTDDLNLDAQAHAFILRSPHAHAEIVSIDYSEALKMPGVFAVVTGDDMAAESDPMIVGFENPIDYYGIAVGKARYVGEPVAVVAATDRYRAEDALELIKVEYNVLPAVIDPVRAADPDMPTWTLSDDADKYSSSTWLTT